jgi:hypothetical protein
MGQTGLMAFGRKNLRNDRDSAAFISIKGMCIKIIVKKAGEWVLSRRTACPAKKKKGREASRMAVTVSQTSDTLTEATETNPV